MIKLENKKMSRGFHIRNTRIFEIIFMYYCLFDRQRKIGKNCKLFFKLFSFEKKKPLTHDFLIFVYRIINYLLYFFYTFVYNIIMYIFFFINMYYLVEFQWSCFFNEDTFLDGKNPTNIIIATFSMIVNSTRQTY